MFPDIVRDRLPRVMERIHAAAERAGRSGDDVRLVAVTKGHPVEAVQAVVAAGVTHVGENRVEELERKVPMIGAGGPTWHMIGHLQRRKAGRAAELADLIHSVDTIRLGERLSRVGEELGKKIPVLIQVNTSGEASKGGFPIPEAIDGIGAVAELQWLDPQGLMTMAPFTKDEATIRSAFQDLRRTLEAAFGTTGLTAKELSMGMSNDFDIAIEEGSTMVRLGTALLGERHA